MWQLWHVARLRLRPTTYGRIVEVVERIRFLPTFCAGKWWVDSYLGGECEIIVEL